ncbi:MAG: indolepyruvate ferredoxin oxidoreductase family protein [Gammaproteobacteria bacterium]|nr:indolepyruvate ferredoxin oxidoreductase family protein [Gammaproteobacteria bacterium]MYD75605.1 indolepyruvate ferredoxin oxidoreductase family protein [Gammaproteobacteria bacterium]MYJ53056.1 indolepyruvate ferredoxin oxidoreductase family protein [Gammaproteobacteria bacterium]
MPASFDPADVSLDDKYALTSGRAFMTGIEALVRLPMIQYRRDREAGLNTAGFISGYRGSPLGTLDQSLWKAQSWLERHSIVFQPGVNEDLAATAVWGTQQTHLLPGARHDGIFAMWYGKGPGVDRSMDVIKHANMFGTTRHGGVLALAGDDHACKSSTLPHQSEHNFVGASVPVLNPANVQDVLDYGIYGWGLSRFSGCWVAMKAITENMDTAISADLDPNRVRIVLPEDCEIPPEGLNAQWPTTPLEQERLLNRYRIYSARAFAYSNGLNRVMLDTPNPRLGIVTSGKSYLDVMEAMADLGIDDETASRIGIRIFKIGMSWPLEPISTHEFARGLDEILVVEEKRSVIEDQITGQLYNWPVSARPVVVGEFDEDGKDLVTNLGELTPAMVARAIGTRVLRFHDSESIRERLRFLDAKERRLSATVGSLTRTPYFCSGCPHNTSTKVPEGSHGLAGIGCHYMVKWMNRNTETFTQMGGEGASWIGQAPFTETAHVFQNLGDGTYFHSGILAIRAAIASGVNITYKLLYNDAVAMTGGQPVDGTMRVPDIVDQLKAEGVTRLVVVSENHREAKRALKGRDGITVHPKSDFDRLQEEIRDVKGTSVIIFDQTCAAEKRRRRKRGEMPESPVRVFIHPEICEACGDCSVQSNCLSVLPKRTALGTKRQIDQSACNHDFSCLKGFCPSFVTVTGGTYVPVEPHRDADFDIDLPEPVPPAIERSWNILVAGIGGTGVLTVGSILAMAAHLENKGCATLNQTGLAQKFGAVVSHVRIARTQDDILAVRIPDGDADLLLGCDLVVASGRDSLTRLGSSRSHAVVNAYESPTADFILDPEYRFPGESMKSLIKRETGEGRSDFINATAIARNLLGNSIASNLFLLGYAFQRGLIPVSEGAISRAIELNGVAVDLNRQAFRWGRLAVVDPKRVEKEARVNATDGFPETLDEIIEHRHECLVRYQDARYAERYRERVEAVRRHEEAAGADPELPLTAAVAHNYFRLLAYKDEYEVARLYAESGFLDEVRSSYRGRYRFSFLMAPPLLSKRDPHTGHPLKRTFPGGMLTGFRILSRLKFLRGTVWDVFGKTRERRLERELIRDYESDIDLILESGNETHREALIELAALPDMVRGFGHIKLSNIEKYRQRRGEVLGRISGSGNDSP